MFESIPLSRFLLKPPKDLCVDHINGKTHDNRRCNLRICNHKQNMQNTKKRKKTKSKYKGVFPIKGKRETKFGVWVKKKYYGRYSKERWAAMAYNHIAKKEFGKFASLNKIDD